MEFAAEIVGRYRSECCGSATETCLLLVPAEGDGVRSFALAMDDGSRARQGWMVKLCGKASGFGSTEKPNQTKIENLGAKLAVLQRARHSIIGNRHSVLGTRICKSGSLSLEEDINVS